MHYDRTLILAGVASVFLAACAEEYVSAQGDRLPQANCLTEEGPAHWTGTCVNGRAQGEGLATYRDGHVSSIEGSFAAGVPQGEVVIDYGSGTIYRGTLKDGEFHGTGTYTRGWGESYSGGWSQGFRDGEGTFTDQDGRAVDGLWQRGRLLGSWYTDGSTGCEVWWAATGSDPDGELTWSGSCVGGRASGSGTISWTDETPDSPSGTTIEFVGDLSGGKLNGEGIWRQTDRYTNVIHHTVRRGTWADGMRTGFGTDRRESEFLEGNFSAATISYEGGWERDQYSGFGERIDSKTYDHGGVESFTERGTFVAGTLHEGVAIMERRVVEGEDSVQMTSGRFISRSFVGYGNVISRYRNDDGYTHSTVRYEGPISEGGTGAIHYSDGDVFTGQFEADIGWGGSPSEGYCNLQTVGFIGPCQSIQERISDYQWRTCLSPIGDDEQCLRVIASFVS